MSLSLKDIFDKLQVGFVPLAALFAGGLAVWLGLTEPVNVGNTVQKMPEFDFAVPDQPPGRQTGQELVTPGPAEPFQANRAKATAEKKTEPLDLQEIQLGMVVVSKGVKICLTNGRMMHEGQVEPRFAVDTIEAQGVWYTTEKQRVFVNVGGRMSIDQDGNTQRLPQKSGEETKKLNRIGTES